MSKKVIIFGASGKTGIEICKQLNNANIQHSAFVRTGSEVNIKTQKTEFIFGNVLDKNDIEKAFTTNEFTDVVIALGSRDFKTSFIRSETTENIVDTLNKLSLKYNIHLVSALGVNESWVQLNWLNKLFCKLFIKNAMIDHGLQENIVVKSNQNFHIVRPVGLKDGEAIGSIIVQPEGFLPYNDIRRADVAKYLVDSLLKERTGFSSICKA